MVARCLGGFGLQDDVMSSTSAAAAARRVGHPILRILTSFPIACFSGALATDIVYSQTAGMIWANFSAWLLAAGMFSGILTAIGGFLIVVTNSYLRRRRRIWSIALGCLLVLILGFFNNLIHSRDAWTSVVPMGLVLSAATVVATLITAWFGSAAVDRYDAVPGRPGVRQ
jgi:uncharacterized membrane protein